MVDEKINNWSEELGLLPMPLFQNQFIDEKFILLNGNRNGNLCIDFNSVSINEARNLAWSSDVGNYLLIGEDNIKIYNWENFKTEKYNLKRVNENLPNFYNHLKQQNQNKQESVIKFCIYLFRKIRSLIRDGNGLESLNVLLYLFACNADEVDRNDLNLKNWSFQPKLKEFIFSHISNSYWGELNSIVNLGLINKSLKPKIDLILRHASGTLFQEAHFEMNFSSSYQLPIFGLPDIQSVVNKKKSGVGNSAHFTPTSIVRTIVEQSIANFPFEGKKEITVFDPACGSGEFLKEFIRQIKLNTDYKGSIKIIGWDISETAIGMSNFIINYEALPYGTSTVIELLNKNSLEDGKDWNIKADFILMNPPFLSWELMSEEEREKVSAILGNIDKKRQNSAAAFLWNAVKSLNPNGRLSCVLPASIFENESYLNLRQEIKALINIKVIGRLGSHNLFSEALVDTSIFLGIKENPQHQNPLVFWSDFRNESNSTSLRELRKIKNSKSISILSEPGYSIYSNPNLVNGNNWMPIPYKSFELLNHFALYPKVEDIFDVMQGARTGFNSIFVVSNEFYNLLGKKEKRFFRPAVANESISNGQLNNSYYVFYPHGSYLSEDVSEKNLEDLVPIYYKTYLKSNEKRLKNRKGINQWWEMTRPRNWQKDFTPKIVSKEFGKAGDFAFDFDGTYVAERSHAWLLRNGNTFDEIGYAYICVLAMPIINDLLAGLSKQISGGQWYLSSKFINKMPIPNLYDGSVNAETIERLVEFGRMMSIGKQVDKELLANFSRNIYVS